MRHAQAAPPADAGGPRLGDGRTAGREAGSGSPATCRTRRRRPRRSRPRLAASARSTCWSIRPRRMAPDRAWRCRCARRSRLENVQPQIDFYLSIAPLPRSPAGTARPYSARPRQRCCSPPAARRCTRTRSGQCRHRRCRAAQLGADPERRAGLLWRFTRHTCRWRHSSAPAGRKPSRAPSPISTGTCMFPGTSPSGSTRPCKGVTPVVELPGTGAGPPGSGLTATPCGGALETEDRRPPGPG